MKIEILGKVYNVTGRILITRLWFFATYPLQLAVGYIFFGWVGVAWVACMIALNHRGKL